MRIAVIITATAAMAAAQSNAVSEGARIFSASCAACHGAYGEGGRGAALNTGSFRHGNSSADLFRTIRNGVPNSEMPGSNMPDADIDRLVAFLQQLGQSPAAVVAGDPAAGQTVFLHAGCGSCHLVQNEGSDFGPDLSRIGTRP